MPPATSVGPQPTVAEVGGERQAVGDHRDRLGRRQRAGRDLQARAAVGGDPVAQLAEDRDHALDLVGGGRHLGQGQRLAELTDPAGDDRHLLVRRGGKRQHDGVEPPAQGAGQLVHPAVAVVGRGDEVEPAHRRHLGVQLGHRQHLLGQDRDERVLHLRGHPGELLDPDQAPGAHRPVHRARHEGGLARALGRAGGRSSSRSATTPRWCPPSPGRAASSRR